MAQSHNVIPQAHSFTGFLFFRPFTGSCRQKKQDLSDNKQFPSAPFYSNKAQLCDSFSPGGFFICITLSTRGLSAISLPSPLCRSICYDARISILQDLSKHRHSLVFP